MVIREFYVLKQGEDVLVDLENDLPVMYETLDTARYASFGGYEPVKIEIGYRVEHGNYQPRDDFRIIVELAHKNEQKIKKLKKQQASVIEEHPFARGLTRDWLRD